MDKRYKHQEIEKNWYTFWEKKGYFRPEANKVKTPFAIILPPPNANADLHLGHAMYTVEDIMIRYHRMKGDATLWLPGADHAGFETQFVFEKKLQKEGKSRFDFDRETLYKMIWDFVHENRGNMENQLRRLGFSLDWSRQVFTLDPEIIKIVHRTFKKLHDDGLLYRDNRLVNYCTKDGTGFSDLEVLYVERTDPLYYMKYGPFTIATSRPETKFRDTALAVNPDDKRYKSSLGKTFEIMGLLGPVKMTVIPDPEVDPDFGTGIMKVTPAHDPHDFELGHKFNLSVTPIIDFAGRMDFSWFLSQKNIDPKYRARAEKYHGKKVKAARDLMVEDLKADGLLIKTDEKYTHRIGTCYKCGATIEPLPLPQWYIKIRPLADKAIASVKSKKIKFAPKRYEKIALQWLTNFRDWNISRQVVWGIRIPAWKCLDCRNDEWIVTDGNSPSSCPKCKGQNLEQDPDTFDTWFSSGQWPFATLEVNSKKDFGYFYPTSVMETGYDILPWWVCRMIMLGLYATGEIPFQTVCLHGLVRDAKGQKMSKSRGNVINPLSMADLYGADALRMALVFGTAFGNDVPMSEDKIRGMRNFSNKLWNIGRFVKMHRESYRNQKKYPENLSVEKSTNAEDKKILGELTKLTEVVTETVEEFRFDKGAEALYEFLWHSLADKYIEAVKDRLKNYDRQALAVLTHVFITSLKLLHPFMPFITEELNKQLSPENRVPLIVSPWPVVK
ncbi:MAG: valyl-tRNA synthetase, valyl-tRNA synthetase [Candidatus Gottesmanbacteria bacterium GW2011_GWA2_43_14]|uniref:Valine--tRNA ligase n=1 Tax=Candidatus Gottesmanbacteria bacterium GW2011_GWA2_43_14 TaxID=1618443 RepID=A0A0G1DKM2_9BACT|nr:MAG: valyl-tRNA synthetase, valyl-tRNA synthetase [Candidatus Gottesmanbacteria bacterium GW2011_GWA2_43_14]